jgi:hypothetical protein
MATLQPPPPASPAVLGGDALPPLVALAAVDAPALVTPAGDAPSHGARCLCEYAAKYAAKAPTVDDGSPCARALVVGETQGRAEPHCHVVHMAPPGDLSADAAKVEAWLGFLVATNPAYAHVTRTYD